MEGRRKRESGMEQEKEISERMEQYLRKELRLAVDAWDHFAYWEDQHYKRVNELVGMLEGMDYGPELVGKGALREENLTMGFGTATRRTGVSGLVHRRSIEDKRCEGCHRMGHTISECRNFCNNFRLYGQCPLDTGSSSICDFENWEMGKRMLYKAACARAHGRERKFTLFYHTFLIIKLRH